jgi:hypothetical protein
VNWIEGNAYYGPTTANKRPVIVEGKKRILLENNEFFNLNWGRVTMAISQDSLINETEVGYGN